MKALLPRITKLIGHIHRINLLLITLGLLGFSSVANSDSKQPEPLLGGVAKIDITPRLNQAKVYTLADERVTVTDIHDPLYIRSLALKQGGKLIGLLVADVIFLDNATQASIRKQAKTLGYESVQVISSHSHSAMLSGLKFPPEFHNNQHFIDKALKALTQAQTKLVAIETASVSSQIDEISNRRLVQPDGQVKMIWQNPQRKTIGITDPELGVIQLRQISNQKPLATLVNYSAHPTITSRFDGITISADYPSALASAIEDSLGGEVLFLPGAMGDQDPYDSGSPDQAFEKMQLLGQKLADRVLAALKESTYQTVAVSITEQPLTLKKRDSALIPDQSPHQIAVSTLNIGASTALVFLPGELFVELGLQLKQQSPFANTFVVGFSNYYLDYVPTLKALTEGGYGASSATDLAPGSGEMMIHQALVQLYAQSGKVKPLASRY